MSDNKFPQKYQKVLPMGWDEVAQSMKDDELKRTVFECEGNMHVIEKAKDADSKLQKAKEEAKEAGAIYSDAKKVQMAKIKYALYLLEDRGVDLDKGGN